MVIDCYLCHPPELVDVSPGVSSMLSAIPERLQLTDLVLAKAN
jgi:hypothetical protein